MNWQKDLKIKPERKVLLKNHTTFKIGGPADYFFCPKSRNQLKLLIKAAKRYKIPILVIGAGSNILASDKGVRTIVVKLSAKTFKKTSIRNNSVYAASAVTLPQLINICQKHGLSGLENLVGVPGTVGGALVMNASAWGRDIKDTLREVEVMDRDGRIKILKKAAVSFGYRKSGLGKYIILGARFDLTKIPPPEIKNRMLLYIKQRRSSQDLSYPSAGCIFKNPSGKSAGRLIDACGLKGMRLGDAAVSGKHANFIVNLGKAGSEDVIGLMKLIETKVRNKFNINLKPEIKIWN